MTKQETLGPRLFTLEEAEALIPFLRTLFSRFQDLHFRWEEVGRDLAVLRLVAASGGSDENPDLAALQAKEREQAGLLRRLKTAQREVLESGCLPKSYQEGLVDFFALRGERLVFLCWKQGEDRIQAWHTIEGGFGGRMPIATFLGAGESSDAGPGTA